MAFPDRIERTVALMPPDIETIAEPVLVALPAGAGPVTAADHQTPGTA